MHARIKRERGMEEKKKEKKACGNRAIEEQVNI